jgi:hypothetical protein
MSEDVWVFLRASGMEACFENSFLRVGAAVLLYSFRSTTVGSLNSDVVALSVHL